MDDYDDDDEIPYEFQDGYLSEWYGTSNDEELQDAIDSDDPDDYDRMCADLGWDEDVIRREVLLERK